MNANIAKPVTKVAPKRPLRCLDGDDGDDVDVAIDDDDDDDDEDVL